MPGDIALEANVTVEVVDSGSVEAVETPARTEEPLELGPKSGLLGVQGSTGCGPTGTPNTVPIVDSPLMWE